MAKGLRTSRTVESGRRARRRGRARTRRGVVSVVSMMFLILFGSLAAAMAIMSRGNIITAATHQHVTRAQGAAETGLAVAQRRLVEALGRFVVEKGTVDAGFGDRLWTGGFLESDGEVRVLPPKSYESALGDPAGVVEALAQIHLEDDNIIVINGIAAPTIGPAPDGTDDSVYKLENWLRTPAVALTPQQGAPSNAAFQVEYAPLANGIDVRVIVTGYDFDYDRGGEPIRRRIMQDFRMTKRVDAAVISPSRIMVGKNVAIHGNLGAGYDQLAHEFGDPLVLRSDFLGLDPQLDNVLNQLFNGIAEYDVDGDNRLRVGHPVESLGIPDVGGNPDVTGDGYVDEFDLFILRFDRNGDGRIVLPAELTVGTPAEGMASEFLDESGNPIDLDLARLIDSSNPDRNRNGIASFIDNNNNGTFEPEFDVLVDQQPAGDDVPPELERYVHESPPPRHFWSDQVLGYRDGFIDRRDQYAKVKGGLKFRVTAQQWIEEHGAYQPKLRGPIHPGQNNPAIQFGLSEDELPELDASSFTNSQTAFKGMADGDGRTFKEQVALQLGVPPDRLDTWTLNDNSADPNAPWFSPLYPDADNDSLPDNNAWAYFEKMPYNSPNYSDWYYRPVYKNMVFRNVQIPMGNNGLFVNCTFVGVTWVRADAANSHSNWINYGKMQLDENLARPMPSPSRFIYGDQANEIHFPEMLLPDDRPVKMATIPLDKADIPADQVAFTQGYDLLPDPLLIDGYRCTDTKDRSNNLRFHDCLFVGSIVSDAPEIYTHARNKLQFSGATKFTQEHPEYPEDPELNPDPEDRVEIAKSSLMLPQYSVDIGRFNSPREQDVRLRGTIVAGVLDVRGNASIDGALLLTFKPIRGQPPLVDSQGNPVGNPALFNTTLGYFGPDDGDDESLDPATLPIIDGVRVAGYDTNGDGIADIGPFDPPPPGAVIVPFNGYGAITLRFDPTMQLPDGIMLPLKLTPLRTSYRESSR